MSRSARRAASALITSLACLAVVSLLGLAYLRLSSLERDSAVETVRRVHARFAAEAGIEFAASRLRERLRESVLSEPDAPGSYPVAADGSFADLDRTGRPSIEIPGTGLSGRLDSRDGTSITFKLRVLDTAGMIHVNDPSPALPAVLSSLAQVLGLPPAVGTSIVEARPAGGYLRKSEIRRVVDAESFAQLEPYLTCSGVLWPTTARTDGGYATASRGRIGVNLAPVPVLSAALAGLSAAYGSRSSRPVSLDESLALARALVARREGSGAFRHRTDLERFLSGEGAAAASLDGAQVDCLLAALDPHFRPAHLNDDLEHVRAFDLGDLERPAIPFILVTSGVFEVDSVGEVVSSDGTVLASQRVDAVLRIARVRTVETQAAFEAARTDARGTLSGPEPLFRTTSALLDPPPAGSPAPSSVAGSIQLE